MGVISSIFPDNVQCNDPGGNVTLQVRGSDFVGTDKINYDGADQGSTNVISSTLMTMTLNPLGASRPRIVPIKVTGDPTVKYFWWTPEAIIGGTKAWYPPTP